MFKWLLSLTLAVSAFGQYKAEPAGVPPPELNPAIAATLQKEGTKIVGPNGPVAEIWFRSAAPKGAKTAEAAVTFTNVPHGSLMGVMRFPNPGTDRRGQPGGHWRRRPPGASRSDRSGCPGRCRAGRLSHC